MPMPKLRFQKVTNIDHDELMVEVINSDGRKLFVLCLDEHTGLIDFRSAFEDTRLILNLNDLRQIFDEQEKRLREWAADVKTD